MPPRVQNEKLRQLREKFGQDLARLRERYENLEISRKMGINPGNLSSYASGGKAPGIKVLMHFYEVFANEIQNPFDEASNIDVAEAAPLYRNYEDGLTNELNAALKTENGHLRSTNSKMLENTEKILDSMTKMVAAQEKLVQTIATMAESHKIFLQKYGGEEKHE